ncbi:hypothetical protein O3P69_014759 [Scylla paramamosain]|uniref:Uncharacterized protein n=1 Tax=Scylla paramamosain TaxID=85552 RepID=A0AAW0U0X8_SCYPA
MCSFLGLVEFTPQIAESAKHLRLLLSPQHAFTWTPGHDLDFELQRLKKIIVYSYVFTAEWRKGKSLGIPDPLFHALVDKPSPEDVALGEEACICVRGVVANRAGVLDVASSAGDLVLDSIHTAAHEDPVYVKPLEYVTRSFPATCNSLGPTLLPY